jgi:chromosome segregation ATPase
VSLTQSCRKTQAALKERNEMFKELERGIDEVNALYSKKEKRLEGERDAAKQELRSAQEELDKTLSALETAQANAAAAVEGREEAASEAEASRKEAKMSFDGARKAEGRLKEVEAEMRVLLDAFEEEKAANAAKAAQLSAILQAWT